MKKSLILLLIFTLVVTLFAGCATEDAPSEEPADDPGVEEPAEPQVNRGKVVVSSKEWTEPLVLGEITMQYLEYLGYDVEDRTALGPTPLLRDAMKADEIDIYWEYTSTVLVFEAGFEQAESLEMSHSLVKEWDLAENNIIWGAPTTANNTYVLITTPEFAEENGFSTTSELAALINDGVPVRAFFGLETFERPDGVLGMEKFYGFEFDRNLLTTGMSGLDHETLRQGKTDVAMALSTQGQIKRFNEFVVEDDKGFFPPYMACYTLRGEVADENPMLVEEMDALSPYITNENLISMNDAVELDGESASDVAERFLKENGLID